MNHRARPLQALRAVVGLMALPNLLLAVAFASQQQWALRLWPWDTGRLSYLFLASMLAAIGAGAAWIGVSGELGSLPAGFANLTVTLAGIAGYLLTSVPELRGLGMAVGILALVNLGLLLLSTRLPGPRGPRIPPTLRASYVVFIVVLLAVGIALVAGIEGVMPWPVDPNTSVVFGWIFFGDAFYFAYAVARPHWDSARTQLWSFLAYDAVLLPPLVAHMPDVDPGLRVNLLIYLAVLGYSAALALYYLIANPRTRGWGARSSPQTSP